MSQSENRVPVTHPDTENRIPTIEDVHDDLEDTEVGRPPADAGALPGAVAALTNPRLSPEAPPFVPVSPSLSLSSNLQRGEAGSALPPPPSAEREAVLRRSRAARLAVLPLLTYASRPAPEHKRAGLLTSAQEQCSMLLEVLAQLDEIPATLEEAGRVKADLLLLYQVLDNLEAAAPASQPAAPPPTVPAHAAQDPVYTPSARKPTPPASVELLIRQASDTADALDALAVSYLDIHSCPPTLEAEIVVVTEKLKLMESEYSNLTRRANTVEPRIQSEGLTEQSHRLYEASMAAESARVAATNAALEWRTKAGLLTSGKKGTSYRRDVRPPTFEPKEYREYTVYEFRADWDDFMASADLTTEGALRVLKDSVTKPTQLELKHLEDIEEVFAYLIAKYGDVRALISARKTYFRNLPQCKESFTHFEQRDWLAAVKVKLDSITKLCTQHKLLSHLHHSDIIEDVLAKMSTKAQRPWEKLVEANINESGVVPEEVRLGMLRQLITSQIKLCSAAFATVGAARATKKDEPKLQAEAKPPTGSQQKMSAKSNNKQTNVATPAVLYSGGNGINGNNPSSSGGKKQHRGGKGNYGGSQKNGANPASPDLRCGLCSKEHTTCSTARSSSPLSSWAAMEQQQSTTPALDACLWRRDGTAEVRAPMKGSTP